MNIGSSLSALNAFSTQMNITANNVANVDTDGYKSRSVAIEGGPGHTVKANVVTNDSQGFMTPDKSAANGMEELSNVDIVNEMTQMIPAQNAYDANLKVIETNYQMLGTILSMFA